MKKTCTLLPCTLLLLRFVTFVFYAHPSSPLLLLKQTIEQGKCSFVSLLFCIQMIHLIGLLGEGRE